MPAFFTPVRDAWRRAARQPGVSLAVVLPVALALAVSTALFSIVDGLLFRPLPFADPDALVSVDHRRVGRTVVPGLMQLIQRQDELRTRLLESDLVAGAAVAREGLAFGEDAIDLGLRITGVDARFFPLLGLSPLIGAGFHAESEALPGVQAPQPDRRVPVILGYDVWQRLFGGTASVLGDADLAGRPVRIAGVMPPGVRFPGDTNVWVQVLPRAALPASYVRLADAATIDALRARLPEFAFTPLRDAVRPGGTGTLVTLASAAGLLVLIAWVQVAALLLSVTAGRLRELGTRLALGAGARRLAAQLALENGLLVVMAAGLAWMAAAPLVQVLTGVLPADLSTGQYLEPDRRTFAFAVAVALTGVGVLTMAPAIVVRHASVLRLLNGRLRERSRGIERWQTSMLVGQLALTALLLYLAGMGAQSYARAATYDYGFDADNVLVFSVRGLRLSDFEGGSRAWLDERYQRLTRTADRLSRLDGIAAAATLGQVPLVDTADAHWEEVIEFGGAPLRVPVPAAGAAVSRNVVEALGATVVDGGTFDDPPYASRTDVALVNETLAAMLSPAVEVLGVDVRPSVVGREIRTSWFRGRIVGVVNDLVVRSPDRAPDPLFLVPAGTRNFGVGRYVLIRTAKTIDESLPAIRTVLRDTWGVVPERHLRRLDEAVHESLTPFRAQSALLGLIAAACVPLAALGVAGALLYSVRRRTRDVAIRMALGASPAAVRRRLVTKALAIAGGGIALGLAAGLVAGRTMRHLFFQVHPADPWAIAGVAAVLFAVAWMAAGVPAQTASRVDPAEVLRNGA